MDAMMGDKTVSDSGSSLNGGGGVWHEDSSIDTVSADTVESALINQDVVALGGITQLHDNDIICGRSSLATKHPGNAAFRNIILQNKEFFASCHKAEKLRIPKSIVAAIRKINGRFLERQDGKASRSPDKRDEYGNPVKWQDIGDKRAIEKTSQALREGQPLQPKQPDSGEKLPGLANHGVAAAAQPNQVVSNAVRKHPVQRKASQPRQKTRSPRALTSSRNVKKQCLRPQQRHQVTVPTVVTVSVGLSVLSKCWAFLSITDVHSVSLTCTKWRSAVCNSAPLWEGLIAQRYHSHQNLPEGWCKSGREEYMRRMMMMKSQFCSVRDLAGLPLPLQMKTPGTMLMQKWSPKAVVFLVDIFSGRNHFDDDVSCYRHDPVEHKKYMGPQVPIYSTLIRVPSSDNGRNAGVGSPFRGLTLDEERMCVYEELQLSPEYEEERSAIKAIENFHDATIGNALMNGLRDVGGLYVEMSYYVEGGSAPKCEPITLLSEHHTFFVNRPDGRITFRTDVEPAWLPGRHDWDNCESVWDKEESLLRSKVLSRQIAKYSNAPLPFDPQIELRLSPPGMRSMGHVWEDAFENDSRANCSLFAEIGFSLGEDDFDCHFANLVVPSLLSLWNDAANATK